MSPFRPEQLAIVSLWAEDLPTTVHFYRHVVGLPLLPHHDHPPAFDLGSGQYLAIVEGQPAFAQEPARSRFPVLAFSVRDLDEAVQHLQNHNIELVAGIETGASQRWIRFYDPAGNLIELVQFDRTPHS
ncbi:MAG: VOC family protein [Anaerolineae bacterium]|jgi:catechol 2,3-dioxygenase-like lactoylglutathione lyase family enzyme